MAMRILRTLLVGLSSLLLASCLSQDTPSPTLVPSPQSSPISPTSSDIRATPTSQKLLQPTTSESFSSSSPTGDLKTLTICLGAEPDNLFLYGGQMLVKMSILEAIYDGPIDPLGFDYHPVILEKLPSLADGDAWIEPVAVNEGDWVVNDAGKRVQLISGERIRPFGCTYPDCAVTWDGNPVEMAQLSAEFRLKDGILWSDGEPLTVDDSIYSYQLAQECQNLDICNPSSGLVEFNPGPIENIAKYEKIDTYTVRWIGLPGYLDQNYRVNFFHPLPKHRYTGKTLSELMEDEEATSKPIGWGAYFIEKWVFGEEIRLAKNPNYFRAAEGLPRFDRLVFKIVGENSPTNISHLLSGECALVDQDANLGDSVPELMSLDSQGLLQFHHSIGTTWEHADFSILHSSYDDGYQPGVDRPNFFGDVRTRQAFAMCMDRQRVVSEVMLGLTEIPDTYVPKGHPLYNPDMPHYEFDPEAGKALLTEVGWIDQDNDPTTPRIAEGVMEVPDGTPLSVNYWTTSANLRQAATEILAASLGECGIQVNLQLWNASDFFEGSEKPLYGRNFDIAEFALLTYARPPCEIYLAENIPGDPLIQDEDGQPRFPGGWGGINVSGFSMPEYEDACQAALAALPGQPEYRERHNQAQVIFAAELPVVPLFMRYKVTAAQADLCGYKMDPTANSDTWGIEEYYVDDSCR